MELVMRTQKLSMHIIIQSALRNYLPPTRQRARSQLALTPAKLQKLLKLMSIFLVLHACKLLNFLHDLQLV